MNVLQCKQQPLIGRKREEEEEEEEKDLVDDESHEQSLRCSELDQILLLASTWEQGKAGQRRLDDGTLPGWYEWSQRYPQRNHKVRICQGRSEWRRALVDSRHPNRVAVVSWNILSDHWVRQSTYQHIGSEGVTWSKQFPALVDWWQAFGPVDVLALQEVDYGKYDSFIRPTL